MKKLLYICLILFFVCGLAFIAEAEEYSWHQAKKHIGEEATVCGRIIDNVDAGGIQVLGMGKGVTEQGAVGVEIGHANLDKFPKDLYKGKTICVTGKIHRNPVGGASLEITDPSQVQVK